MVEFGQAQDRRFFDNDVPTGFDPLLRRRKMFVIGRSDAEEIDPAREEIADGIFAKVISKVRQTEAPGVGGGAVPRAGRGSGEFDAEGSGGAIVDTMPGSFEEGRVGLVEDHAHTDHAAAEDGESGGIRGEGGHGEEWGLGWRQSAFFLFNANYRKWPRIFANAWPSETELMNALLKVYSL